MRQKPFKGKEASVYLTFYEQEPGQGSYLETKKKAISCGKGERFRGWSQELWRTIHQ